MNNKKVIAGIITGAVTGAVVAWFFYNNYSKNKRLLKEGENTDDEFKELSKNKRAANRLKKWQLHHHINANN